MMTDKEIDALIIERTEQGVPQRQIEAELKKLKEEGLIPGEIGVSQGAISKRLKAAKAVKAEMVAENPTVENKATVEQSTDTGEFNQGQISTPEPESTPAVEVEQKASIDEHATDETGAAHRGRGRPTKPETKQNQKARSSVEATAALASREEIELAEAAMKSEVRGEFLSIAAVATAMKTTIRTVQNYLKSGKLRGVKIAGNWVIASENIRRFMLGE